MSFNKIKFVLLFDLLPTEIIFQIFKYLSNNDIIYAFFNTSQRLQNLLLQNQSYLNHLELPTKNIKIWKNLLSTLGSHIQCLIINTIHLSSFPLSYFLNLTTLIVSLPYTISNAEFEFIFQSKQFSNIKSFKIKENKLFSNGLSYERLTHQTSILNKIFHEKNSLETFEYSLPNSPLKLTSTNNFPINLTLHSLTLTLNYFHTIFHLLKSTPNLIYLNLQSILFNRFSIPSDKLNIKLKEFHLTLSMDSERMIFCDGQHNTIKRFSLILNFLQQFSSTLNFLSLNLSRLNLETMDSFACNSLRFEQFLQSMNELKEFHLYEKLFLCPMDNQRILFQYKNSNLSFGMHRNYFYTLPFYFKHLYEFSEGFHGVQSNHPEIFVDNPRIWYNVKSIELPFAEKYEKNFVEELKRKMPKLISIKFVDSHPWATTAQTTDFNTMNDRIDLTRLENVTSIHMAYGSMEYKKEWLIHSTPNLKHLALSHGQLPSTNNKLRRIVNEKLVRLDIYEYYQFVQLVEMNNIYSSNIQYINFCYNNSSNNVEVTANIVMRILVNFQNLKVLFIYIRSMMSEFMLYPVGLYLKNLIQCLDMNEIKKNYQVKSSNHFCLFLKQELDDDSENESMISRLFSFFSSITRFFMDETDAQTTE